MHPISILSHVVVGAASFVTPGGDSGSAMNPVCYNGGAHDRLIHEADQLISQIERGSTILKFYPRKRPERRSLSVRRETHQIIWSRTGVSIKNAYEGALDIRDIKEVRVGKASKHFERWPEEMKRLDSSKCFTIYYGTEFKLRAASLAGKLVNMSNYTQPPNSRMYCWLVMTLS